MPTITIPKHFATKERLIAIPREEYARLITATKKEHEMTAPNLLRLSREAKQLHQKRKLPLFSDLIKREYPSLAKKHKL